MIFVGIAFLRFGRMKWLIALVIILIALAEITSGVRADDGTGSVFLQIQGYGTVHGQLENAMIQGDNNVSMLLIDEQGKGFMFHGRVPYVGTPVIVDIPEVGTHPRRGILSSLSLSTFRIARKADNMVSSTVGGKDSGAA